MWKEHFGRPEMVEVWKFYCGLTKLAKIDLLPLINSTGSRRKKDREALPPLVRLSLFEADNEEQTNELIEKAIPTDLSFVSSS